MLVDAELPVPKGRYNKKRRVSGKLVSCCTTLAIIVFDSSDQEDYASSVATHINDALHSVKRHKK